MPFTWLQEFVTVILMEKQKTTLSNAIYLVNALSTINILQQCDCIGKLYLEKNEEYEVKINEMNFFLLDTNVKEFIEKKTIVINYLLKWFHSEIFR